MNEKLLYFNFLYFGSCQLSNHHSTYLYTEQFPKFIPSKFYFDVFHGVQNSFLDFFVNDMVGGFAVRSGFLQTPKVTKYE